ncbi:rhomboid family intramembrane serine protease [Bacteroides sp. OttesenSCG-928-J23]|nr:rhomboid family intramembrane serine protease [Bacteroides sp. OttesenSCG-928-N06]MDL2247992.1 rhomboid family intramembrane serine protease [Bacteroides sp. OttesenSCG-928-J23]
MASIITDLKSNFKRGSVFMQLIYINVAVFLATALLSVFFLLFNRSITGVLVWFELPASVERFIRQPWSILSYMFMHADFLHLLFNMLWLYWFGSLFLNFFTSKHLRGLYILGGICGGILYILSFNIFPYFETAVDTSVMVGASASILAIVTAAAYREPHYTLRLFLLGNIQLKYIALMVVLMDLLLMTSGNSGGHIAHLGGALAGVWFAASLSKGKDITTWINHVLDWASSLFDKQAQADRKRKKMKVSRGGNKDYEYNARKRAQEEEIDLILEKLKKSGYNSLTEAEKKKLFDASKK